MNINNTKVEKRMEKLFDKVIKSKRKTSERKLQKLYYYLDQKVDFWSVLGDFNAVEHYENMIAQLTCAEAKKRYKIKKKGSFLFFYN